MGSSVVLFSLILWKLMFFMSLLWSTMINSFICVRMIRKLNYSRKLVKAINSSMESLFWQLPISCSTIFSLRLFSFYSLKRKCKTFNRKGCSVTREFPSNTKLPISWVMNGCLPMIGCWCVEVSRLQTFSTCLAATTGARWIELKLPDYRNWKGLTCLPAWVAQLDRLLWGSMKPLCFLL